MLFWRKSAPAPGGSSPQDLPVLSPADAAKLVAKFPLRDENQRAALREFVRTAPTAHGPWKPFKTLFKAVEAQPQADSELLAALLSRIDGMPYAAGPSRGAALHEVAPGLARAVWDSEARQLAVRAGGVRSLVELPIAYGQVAQVDNIVLVCGGEWRNVSLHFVDVSEAASPALLATVKAQNAYGYNALMFVTRRGNYLLVGVRVENPYNNVRLDVYDVSELASPKKSASLMLGAAQEVAVTTDRIFFIGGNWNRPEVKVADISDPKAPQLGGGVTAGSLGWNRNRLAAQGRIALVGPVSRRTLKVIDGSDAAKPKEAGSVSVSEMSALLSRGGQVFAKVSDGLRLVDVSDPAKPQLHGKPVKAATLAYVKRRARRLLWKIARENPSLYVQLATGLVQGELDTENAWLATDILLGGGARFAQKRHGRAGYELKKPRFVLKTREERFPAVWDKHLDAARQLWLSDEVSLVAREMALKILRANRQEVPALAPAAWEKLLRSASPLLQSVAVRGVLAHLRNRGSVGGATLALALLAAPGKLRGEMQGFVDAARLDKAERRAFGALLQSVVSAPRPDGENAPWRRRNFAATLLAGAWSEFLDPATLLGNLAFWLALHDGAVEARLNDILRAAGASDVKQLPAQMRLLTQQLPQIDEARRETIAAAFLAGASGRELNGEQALTLVSAADIAPLGWRVLEVARLKNDALKKLWADIMGNGIGPEAARIAFSDPVALRSFEKAPFDLPSLRGGRDESPAIFLHGSAAFTEILLRRLDAEHRPTIALRAMALLPDAEAEAVWEKYAVLADGFAPLERDLQRARFYDYNVEPKTRAWDFLARSAISAELLRRLWMNTFRILHWSERDASLRQNAAPTLLRRAAFEPRQLAEILRDFPDILEKCSPAFFLAILEGVPAELRLQLLLAASTERWMASRDALVSWLEDANVRADFWQGLWEKLRGEISPELQERLLGDAAIAGTFEQIAPQAFEAFLKTDNPAHEEWILRWLRAHKPEKGDELLLLAATHSLPGVRRWALGRAEYLRLDLPTALRLMEAELPDCVAAGRNFFEALPPGAAEEIDYALALCDSPGYEARQFGREFIAVRHEALLRGDLLAKLAQGSSPDMQAWLAEKLLETPVSGAATAPFDRAVLRARGRARQAKNLVQARQEKSNDAPLPTATLIELARGRTKRDADWALRQLAQRALAGETIEGVELN